MMSDAKDQKDQKDEERRQRKDRRKARFLPYFGKEKRKAKIVREAEVFEIYIPPLKAPSDRRNEKK
jgi:hypothetical protein